MRDKMPTARLLALLLTLALAAAACGGDADESDEASGDEATTDEASGDEATTDEAGGDEATTGEVEQAELNVGVIPINDAIAIASGIADGTFEANGLTVTSENAAGGAAIIPGVVAGDFDIGFSNIYSVMAAAEAGLDVRIIAAGNFVGDSDFSGIMTLDDTIATPADLEGRTVAVNTLGNLVEITVRETMDKAGADSDTVSFIELPFPEMVGALEAGQVDAITVVEPFVGAATGAGATQVAAPFSEAQPNMMVAVWFTTGEFAEANPNTVAAFASSIDTTNEKLQSDRDWANEIVVAATATPDLDAAAATTLPIFQAGVDTDSLATSAELGTKWGLLSEAPDLDALVN